jgi:threonine dehydrogenase-like Zn-dependent dehydrogenase
VEANRNYSSWSADGAQITFTNGVMNLNGGTEFTLSPALNYKSGEKFEDTDNDYSDYGKMSFLMRNNGGADVVLEVAGAEDTFRLAWECARPNAIVTVVALYDKPQSLPLPDMYGKNLIFKTGGVDGCDCDEILSLIEQGKIDTTPLITHRFALKDIEKAYEIFENKLDGVIKIAVTTE